MSSSSSGSGALGDTSDFRAIFFEEADEHVAAIESVLLRLNQAAPDSEDLNAIFRAAHSIKGTSGMLGFTEIASLTHVLENLLDILRKKERAVTRQDIDALLRAGDVVKIQVAFRRGAAPQAPDMSAAEVELRALIGTSDTDVRRFQVRLGPLAEPIEAGALQTMLAGLAAMGEIDEREIDNQAGGEIRFSVALAGGEADLRSVLELVVAPALVQVEKAGAAPAVPATPAPVEAPAKEDPEAFDMFT